MLGDTLGTRQSKKGRKCGKGWRLFGTCDFSKLDCRFALVSQNRGAAGPILFPFLFPVVIPSSRPGMQ